MDWNWLCGYGLKGTYYSFQVSKKSSKIQIKTHIRIKTNSNYTVAFN